MTSWLPESRLCASPPKQDYDDLAHSPALSLSSSQCSDASYDSNSSQGSAASSTTSLSSSTIAWSDEYDVLSRAPNYSAKADAASVARQNSQADCTKRFVNPSPQSDNFWAAEIVAKRCLPPQTGCPNARRTPFCPTRVTPTLARQHNRRENFVECLVDIATSMVSVIWPNSMVPIGPGVDDPKHQVLPLRIFIKETLRRSKTSFSTLQVALYYLILIKSKAHLPRCDFTTEQSEDSQSFRAMQCGRRMFLAALILASKYLQDRNYSARAWSKISGLKINEINSNEVSFLAAVDWELHITMEKFDEWSKIVAEYTGQLGFSVRDGLTWKERVQTLTPALDSPRKPALKPGPPNQFQREFETGIEHLQPSPPASSEASPSRPSLNDSRRYQTQILRPPPTPLLNSRLTTPVISPSSTSSSTPAEPSFNYSSMPPPLRRMQSDARLNRCIKHSTFSGNWPAPARARTFDDEMAYPERPQTVIGPRLSCPPSRDISRRPSVTEVDPFPMSSRKSSVGSDHGIFALLQAAKTLDWPSTSLSSKHGSAVEAFHNKSSYDGLPSPPSSSPSDSSSDEINPPRREAAPHQPSDTQMASPPCDTASTGCSRRKRRHKASIDLASSRPTRRSRNASPAATLQNEVRSILGSASCSRFKVDDVLEDLHRAKTFVLRSRDAHAQASSHSKAEQMPARLGGPAAGRVPVERGFGHKRMCCAQRNRAH